MQSFLHNNRRFIPGPATDTKLQGYKSFMLDGVVFAYNLCTSFCTRCDFPGGSDSKVSAYNAGDWVPSLDREDPLEKEMATHSSILAWKVPWREEPGWLLSMESQKSRTRLSDFTTTMYLLLYTLNHL